MSPTTQTGNFNPIEVKRFGDLKPIVLKQGEKRVIILSDVHLVHRNVPTRKVITTLKRILSPERLVGIDVIIITGDLFDRRIAYDSHDAWEVTVFLKWLIKQAVRYNVLLRILRGTLSHDEDQPRWFVNLNDELKMGADIRYFDKITVEPLYENGPMCLWIPDDVNHDSTVTWKQAKDVMAAAGVSQVDYAFMHGMFTFQEPIRTVVSHVEERYLAMVKYRIYIGHHHLHARFDIIVVPGSLERLRMNEEEDKGHIEVTFTPTGVVDEYFVVNHEATIFTTLDMVGKSHLQVIEELTQCLSYPDDSWIRILVSSTDESFASLKELKQRFSKLRLAHKLIEEKTTTSAPEALIDRPVMTSIRHDSLPDMIKPKLTKLPREVLEAVDRILAAG